MNKAVYKQARSFHKITGYLLAIQVLLWLLGGLVMSAIPLEKVHGKHLATKQTANPFVAHDYTYNINSLLNDQQTVKQITYTHLFNRPLYLVQLPDKQLAFLLIQANKSPRYLSSKLPYLPVNIF